MTKTCLTIGVDSSSRSCGIAIFENGDLKKSFTKKFDGTFDIQKFRAMAEYFDDLLFDYQPDIFLIEEPLSVRNGRTSRVLNLIGGMIFGLASTQARTIDMIHPSTIKKHMNVKSKEDSIKRVKELHGKRCKTDDEADAILLVDTYMELVDEISQ